MSRRRQKQNNSRYWIISGAVHAIVLVLILMSPAGEIIFEKEVELQPEIVMDEEELADTIDDIRNVAVERLKYQVNLLSEGRTRMATNFETMNKHYQPFVSDQVATARDRTIQEAKRLRELQEELLKSAERAVAEGEGASDPMWRTYDRTRAGIVAGQEELRRSVMLAASDDQDLVELQVKAEEDQMAAFEALQESVSAQNHLWGETQNRERYEGRITSYKSQVEMFSERLENGRQAKPGLEKELKEREAAEPKAKAELAQAQEALEKAKGTDDEKKAKGVLKKAERRVKDAEKYLKRTNDRLAKLEKDLVRNEERLKGALDNLDKYQKEYANYQAGLPTTLEKRDAKAADVVRLQKEAINVQQQVYDRLLVVLEKKVEEAKEEDAAKPEQPEANPGSET